MRIADVAQKRPGALDWQERARPAVQLALNCRCGVDCCELDVVGVILFQSHRVPEIAWPLGLMAVAPFWAAVAGTYVPGLVADGERISALAVAYGALVLAFLGGTRWGAALLPQNRRLLTVQRAIAVTFPTAGLASLLLPTVTGLATLLCFYLLQALWDLVSAEDGHLPYWSAMARVCFVGAIVPALLVLIGHAVL